MSPKKLPNQNLLDFSAVMPVKKGVKLCCPWCGVRESIEKHRVHVCDHMTPGLQNAVRQFAQKLKEVK